MASLRKSPKLGEAVVQLNIYGDVSNARVQKAWADVLVKARDHSPVSNLPTPPARTPPTSRWPSRPWACFTPGRSTMAVCLVSSDSDFTRLAARLREEGVVVYEYGDENRKSFRQACSRFIYTENLRALAPSAPTRTRRRTHSVPLKRRSSKSSRKRKAAMDRCRWELSATGSPASTRFRSTNVWVQEADRSGAKHRRDRSHDRWDRSAPSSEAGGGHPATGAREA